jgi:hypothetical protein
MKPFLATLNFSFKYCFLFIVSVFFFATISSGQEIFSDDYLLNAGTTYYNNNNYRDAQLYLFAYIQRNTALYQSDSNFKSQIDAALQYAASHSSLAGTGGTFIYIPPKRDANGNIISKPLTFKPTLNSNISTSSNSNLNSGKYRCNDGGTYYIRVIKNEIWWYGQSGDSSWSNVMNGLITGDEIQGEWSDVPFGRIKSEGAITLKIISSSSFSIISQTGGFGGTNWNKIILKKANPYH